MDLSLLFSFNSLRRQIQAIDKKRSQNEYISPFFNKRTKLQAQILYDFRTMRPRSADSKPDRNRRHRYRVGTRLICFRFENEATRRSKDSVRSRTTAFCFDSIFFQFRTFSHQTFFSLVLYLFLLLQNL